MTALLAVAAAAVVGVIAGYGLGVWHGTAAVRAQMHSRVAVADAYRRAHRVTSVRAR